MSVDYRDWIGNTEHHAGIVTPFSVEAMSATLDRTDPAPKPGDAVPALWHWMYFPAIAPWSALGPDGHPARGGFLPPIALPRRMFAGARYRCLNPISVGAEIARDAEVLDVTSKQGRTGELVFIKIGYRIHGAGDLKVEEEHDVVYRSVAAPVEPPSGSEPPKSDAPWQRTIRPDPMLLFSYSALTFNGHRIHYDRTYATEEEGYPGLLVHGPLIATWLLELCRDNTEDRPLATFRFRAKPPLFDTHPFQVVGGPGDQEDAFWLQALDADGQMAMDADGTFAP